MKRSKTTNGSVYVDTNAIKEMEFDFRKKVTDVIDYELDN